MSERKRGIICAYCGMAWGYDDESPTPELIKEACDHESICEKNPYTAQIRNLKRELAEARELLASEKITRNDIIERSVKVEQERDEAREAMREAWLAMDETEGTDRMIKWQNKYANILEETK